MRTILVRDCHARKRKSLGTRAPPAENGEGAAPTAGAQAKDKPAEEEPVEYDEHGKPVIKFVKLVGTRKKEEDGKEWVFIIDKCCSNEPRA